MYKPFKNMTVTKSNKFYTFITLIRTKVFKNKKAYEHVNNKSFKNGKFKQDKHNMCKKSCCDFVDPLVSFGHGLRIV